MTDDHLDSRSMVITDRLKTEKQIAAPQVSCQSLKYWDSRYQSLYFTG